MPPNIRFHFRAGHEAGEGQVCCRPDRHADAHHPIIYMQFGPVWYTLSARTMTETTPFEHKVIARYTEFRMAPELTEVTIQDIYTALVVEASRNDMIANDVVRVIESGRCPLLLTGRTEHLQYFAAKLEGVPSTSSY
jgi:hypothetical protein